MQRQSTFHFKSREKRGYGQHDEKQTKTENRFVLRCLKYEEVAESKLPHISRRQLRSLSWKNYEEKLWLTLKEKTINGRLGEHRQKGCPKVVPSQIELLVSEACSLKRKKWAK